MKHCRECQHDISEQAMACPQCGAPFPAHEKWDGWGFEYKSKATLCGLPWLHISFKYIKWLEIRIWKLLLLFVRLIYFLRKGL